MYVCMNGSVFLI